MRHEHVDAFRGANIGHYPALILNADYRPLECLPLSTWGWQDAIHAIILDRVAVVAEYDKVVRSPSVQFRLPSIVALREYVERRQRPSITRVNVLVLRDRNSCAYCGQKFDLNDLTYDHVIPRAQGGKHRWENIVGACLACNQDKADRTPSEAGMTLLHRPYEPTMEELAKADYVINQRKLIEAWKVYIPFAA